MYSFLLNLLSERSRKLLAENDFEYGTPEIAHGPAVLQIIGGNLLSFDTPYFGGLNLFNPGHHGPTPMVNLTTEEGNEWTKWLMAMGSPPAALGFGVVSILLSAGNPVMLGIAIAGAVWGFIEALKAQGKDEILQYNSNLLLNGQMSVEMPINLAKSMFESGMSSYSENFDKDFLKLANAALKDIENANSQFQKNDQYKFQNGDLPYQQILLSLCRAIVELKAKHGFIIDSLEESRRRHLENLESMGLIHDIVASDFPVLKLPESYWNGVVELVSLAAVASSFGSGRIIEKDGSQLYYFPKTGRYRIKPKQGQNVPVAVTVGASFPVIYSVNPKRKNFSSTIDYIHTESEAFGIEVKATAKGVAGVSIFEKDIVTLSDLQAPKTVRILPEATVYINTLDLGVMEFNGISWASQMCCRSFMPVDIEYIEGSNEKQDSDIEVGVSEKVEEILQSLSKFSFWDRFKRGLYESWQIWDFKDTLPFATLKANIGRIMPTYGKATLSKGGADGGYMLTGLWVSDGGDDAVTRSIVDFVANILGCPADSVPRSEESAARDGSPTLQYKLTTAYYYPNCNSRGEEVMPWYAEEGNVSTSESRAFFANVKQMADSGSLEAKATQVYVTQLGNQLFAASKWDADYNSFYRYLLLKYHKELNEADIDRLNTKYMYMDYSSVPKHYRTVVFDGDVCTGQIIALKL